MSTATWVKNELQEHGVSYQEMHHPDAYTSQEVAHQEHFSGHRVAKVVVVMADDRPVELILPASRRVRLDRVQYLMAAREVRLATEEEIERYFTDCETGAIPPLRHWQGVEVIMDTTMQVPGNILFQAGTHRDAVCMPFEEWFRMVNPPVASFSEPLEERGMD
jgi:Ala-tRNA(Pro) deacylase